MALVRKVIDSNYLRSPRLREYLRASSQNHVVLTDYAWLEAYKGNTLVSIFESMAVVSGFSKQVILLRDTGYACGLVGRPAGLRRRLIDDRQSQSFARFCRDLAAARAGHPGLQRSLLGHGKEAIAHLETRVLNDARRFPKVIELLATSYSREELVALRGDARYSESLFKKMMLNVMHISWYLFRDVLPEKQFPDRDELPNSFVFRMALCTYLLALDWINCGGAKAALGAAPTKLRNDFVDMNFATYATYFDGLLTNDAKTKRIYREALCLLKGIGATVGPP